MEVNRDLAEALRQNVETKLRLKARFKQKFALREPLDGKASWEVDVYSYDLVYDTANSGMSKEDIANWRLAGPSASALEAAEQRGLKIKKILETKRDHGQEGRRKPKLAYAWTEPVKGSKQPKVHVVLQEGEVKSPADAVRTAMGKG